MGLKGQPLGDGQPAQDALQPGPKLVSRSRQEPYGLEVPCPQTMGLGPTHLTCGCRLAESMSTAQSWMEVWVAIGSRCVLTGPRREAVGTMSAVQSEGLAR